MCCTIISKYETCLISSDWIEPMASTTVNYRRLQTLNQGKSQCIQAYAGVTIPVMCVAVVRSAALH